MLLDKLILMPPQGYRALIASITLYVIVSPLSTYNTLAMFGLVPSRYVPIQLSITAVMIGFAIIAGRSIGHHCSTNTRCDGARRVFWNIGFYIIGPPVLYIYYRLYLRMARADAIA